VIGGIGVSGLSEAEDERIAQAAITKVYGWFAAEYLPLSGFNISQSKNKSQTINS
jgi:hypothetical protein